MPQLCTSDIMLKGRPVCIIIDGSPLTISIQEQGVERKSQVGRGEGVKVWLSQCPWWSSGFTAVSFWLKIVFYKLRVISKRMDEPDPKAQERTSEENACIVARRTKVRRPEAVPWKRVSSSPGSRSGRRKRMLSSDVDKKRVE